MTYDVTSVKMLAGSDGQLVTAVHVGNEAAQRLSSMGRWYGNRRDGSRASDETSVLSRARKITIFLVAAAAFGWICTRMGGGGEYSAVGQGD